MEFYSTVFSTIDLRSFSNLWFWIAVTVAWSNMTHYIVGVPFDMVLRARRRGGQAMLDLETMAMLQARRRIQIMHRTGPWLVAFWAMVLTVLAVLGFGYGAELAQALTFLLVPMSIASALGIRMAHKLERRQLTGKALTKTLTLHRALLQGIGLLAIMITTIWGVWFNLSIPLMGR